MSKQNPPFPLRIEAETRAKLEAIAKANGRSLNAQIALILDNFLQLNPEAIPVSEEYMTVQDARAFMEEEFRKMYENLLKAGLKPVKDITPDEALSVARDSMQQVVDKRK
ncbi:Arc family DNA-binding protein [Thiothrix winogradskyi]|uniref:Arc family DNA-binding protein n=1 Tax=Thiothrix winogradskyi TaxID=96472 RepID=A0ABY3SZ39_9GAMM|nr:Arc family DNA-binding protein [Thiothrix winogradskyi]UJS24793.1 Arc family DNA-binding protein [Thiothrix winogradskyi]